MTQSSTHAAVLENRQQNDGVLDRWTFCQCGHLSGHVCRRPSIILFSVHITCQRAQGHFSRAVNGHICCCAQKRSLTFHFWSLLSAHDVPVFNNKNKNTCLSYSVQSKLRDSGLISEHTKTTYEDINSLIWWRWRRSLVYVICLSTFVNRSSLDCLQVVHNANVRLCIASYQVPHYTYSTYSRYL